MSEDVLNQLFSTFKVQAQVFHNGQYCGNWAIDTSGSHFLSFHVVTHGQCYLVVNDDFEKVQTLSEGELVLFPHDAKHCLSNDPQFSQPVNTTQSNDFQQGLVAGSTGLVCGYFSHQHPLFAQMTQHMPESIVIKNDPDDSSLLSVVVKALLEESLAADKGSAFILNKLSECVLALVVREHLAVDKGVLAALAEPKIGKAMSAIIQEPQRKWTVDSLAEVSALSRSVFAEQFKQLVGMPPMEYLTHWRLTKAYQLLQEAGTSILAVALEVGYDNESSFSKAFKRVLGMSPGAVRSKSSNANDRKESAD